MSNGLRRYGASGFLGVAARGQRGQGGGSGAPAMMKRIRFALLYVLAMIAVVVAVDYALFWRYVSNLDERERPRLDFASVPNVPETTLRRLGALNNRKLSSFIRFAPDKPAGVIRIGAFGDSFTHGNEVDDSSDFSSQLALLLAKEGIDGVEILNFGSSWHGFGQSYIVWDEIGRRYGLDAILLGPATFYPDRDTRFNHSNGTSPYYLHSRFIVEDGELRLIDVMGDTHAERFRRYFSFLTPWRYLRYDRNDPGFLAAALPEGKTLENPFYYDRRTEQEEAAEIYRGLLQRMVRSGTRVVLGLEPRFEYARRAVADLAGEGFCAAAFERRRDFPYVAPKGHNSPTGNVLVAHQFLSLLLDRPVIARILRTAPLERAAPPVRAPARDLSEYDDVSVVVNGIAAGRFVARGAVRPSFFRNRRIRALLAVKGEESSVLDGVFLGFRGDVDISAAARLELQSSQGGQSVPLARLPETRDELRFGALDLPGFETPRRPSISIATGALAKLFGDPLPSGKLRLVLGDVVVLQGTIDPDIEHVKLDPRRAELYLLRGTVAGDAAADRGRTAGTAEMVLRHGDQTISVPLARWSIEHHALDPSASCPPAWGPALPQASLSNDLRPSGD